MANYWVTICLSDQLLDNDVTKLQQGIPNCGVVVTDSGSDVNVACDAASKEYAIAYVRKLISDRIGTVTVIGTSADG